MKTAREGSRLEQFLYLRENFYAFSIFRLSWRSIERLWRLMICLQSKRCGMECQNRLLRIAASNGASPRLIILTGWRFGLAPADNQTVGLFVFFTHCTLGLVPAP